MIKATNKKSEDFAPIDEGSYPARIYQIIHIGTISGYQGQLQNKVRIGFEFPTEKLVFKEENGEQPRILSQEYTLSFNEKANLRGLIDACDPEALKVDGDGFLEEFNVEELIGKECLVTISHKAKKDGSGIIATISNCTRMPKGMVCEPAINKPQILSYDNWNEELFNSYPDFLKDKIKTSVEYKAMVENPF